MLAPPAAAALAFAVALGASGCGTHTSALSRADACDDAGFLHARSLPAPVAQEVTVCGTVTSLRRARRTRSGAHQYFFVAVRGARPIEVVANTDEMGGPFPVRVAEPAVVRGRYYKDPDGHEGIDWTHHGTSRSWPYPGYLLLDGHTYR